MGNSLRDQLLKTGLADKKQHTQAKQAQYRKQKQQRHAKGDQIEESTLLARQAMAERKEQDRQRNLRLQEEAARKELAAQIGQMVEAARLRTGDGPLAYNFADGTRIKKLYVSQEIRDGLSHGRLAIVRHRERYEVVPVEVAAKIRSRDETAVVLHNAPPSSGGGDDPYAEFPIPDDLEW